MKYQIIHYDEDNLVVTYKVTTDESLLKDAQVLQSSIENIPSVEELERVILRTFLSTLTARQRSYFEPEVEQFSKDNLFQIRDLDTPDIPESIVQAAHSNALDSAGYEPEITLT